MKKVEFMRNQTFREIKKLEHELKYGCEERKAQELQHDLRLKLMTAVN